MHASELQHSKMVIAGSASKGSPRAITWLLIKWRINYRGQCAVAACRENIYSVERNRARAPIHQDSLCNKSEEAEPESWQTIGLNYAHNSGWFSFSAHYPAFVGLSLLSPRQPCSSGRRVRKERERRPATPRVENYRGLFYLLERNDGHCSACWTLLTPIRDETITGGRRRRSVRGGRRPRRRSRKVNLIMQLPPARSSWCFVQTLSFD